MKYSKRNNPHQDLELKLQSIQNDKLMNKLINKDLLLWSKDQDEQKKIIQRLGWLDTDHFLNSKAQELKDFALRVKKNGFTDYVWIGMGGSSLFAHMLSEIFDHNHFHTIDTTDTQHIDHCIKPLNLQTTLFFIASKSGTTLETLSVFDYLKKNVPKQNFVAISDPDTPLTQEFINHSNDYYQHFINPSDIGGRFSSLSYFGLVPLALMSSESFTKNIETVLQSHHTEAFKHCVEMITAHIITVHQNHQANKIILHLPNKFQSFTHWVEQLVAESTGKQEKGFIPLPSEAIHDDRPDYIHITHPPLHTKVLPTHYFENPLELNTDSILLHSYLWMHITALLGHYLNLNPFDEPNVTQSKELTKKILANPSVNLETSDIHAITTNLESLRSKDSDFIALLFYGNLSHETSSALKKLQEKFSKLSQLPCIIYPGPQYLHSVGQYFKGGKNDGHYIILVENHILVESSEKKYLEDIKLAQALGDYQALKKQGRSCLIYSYETLKSFKPTL